MHRFPKNRCWTLILTLTLCLASFAGPRLVHADGTQTFGDPGGALPGAGGDPDVPDQPSKSGRGIGHGSMRPGTNVYSFRQPAGDGWTGGNVVMWRLRVALWSFRIFLIRF